MPPKLTLNVNASVRSFKPGDENDPLMAPSIEIGPSGTLKLYKSFATQYEFNPRGMTRNMVSPLASGASAMQQSFQISEKDVTFYGVLGQGASGLVQKAFWPAKSEFVAVKKISVLERQKRHQLMNDIKALCRMPNVTGLIRFHGAYHSADRGQIAVALEYMDGGSLADVLAKVNRIPEDVLAGITRHVLHGLSYMHANHMVHRDIKPANILMSTSGVPKVSDFGISAFIDNTIAQCHTFLGTVTYMSPERINGQPYSFPADIWALGLTLLECATGKYPYDASGGAIELMIQLMEEECPVPADGSISPELINFVQLCMKKDPLQRPTAEALRQHPFVAKGATADLKGFMQCMYNPIEKLKDMAMMLSSRFYNNLAYNWRESDTIAVFYSSDATLDFSGENFKGRYTIAQKYHDLMRQLSVYGDIVFAVKQVDHAMQPGEQRGIVTITTQVDIQGEMTPSMSEPETLGSFTDTFTVRLTSLDRAQPGTSFMILSQVLTWTQPLVALKKMQATSSANKCRQQ